MATLGQSMIKNAIGLAIFAVVTAGLIAVTQVLTAERIEHQQREAQASALREIIPPRDHDNSLLDDRFQVPATASLGNREPIEGHRARQGEDVIGVILPVIAPDGYSGNIHLLVGISHGGEVLGVRVTSHQETPGLGDKIELRKGDWILSFDGRALDNPDSSGWQVVRDGGEFDQFTGATITPRAVVRAVYRALHFFDEHRDFLLDQTGNGDQLILDEEH